MGLEKKYEFYSDSPVGKGGEGMLYSVEKGIVVKLPLSPTSPRSVENQMFNVRKELEFTKYLKSKGIKVPDPKGAFRVFSTQNNASYPGYVMEYWRNGKAMTASKLSEKAMLDELEDMSIKRKIEIEKVRDLGFAAIDSFYSENILYHKEEVCLIDFLRWRYNGKEPGLSRWNNYEEYIKYWRDHE